MVWKGLLVLGHWRTGKWLPWGGRALRLADFQPNVGPYYGEEKTKWARESEKRPYRRKRSWKRTKRWGTVTHQVIEIGVFRDSGWSYWFFLFSSSFFSSSFLSCVCLRTRLVPQITAQTTNTPHTTTRAQIVAVLTDTPPTVMARVCQLSEAFFRLPVGTK